MVSGLERKPVKPVNSNTPPPSRLWLAIAAILFTLAGGFLGGVASVRYFGMYKPTTTEEHQAVVLSESEVIAGVAESVGPSVVSISVESVTGSSFFSQSFAQESAGTGIIVSEDGLVLTNRHVVAEGAQTVTVFTSDGKAYKDVEVVARDQFNDIAFLKINGAEGLKPARLGDSDAMRVGDKVIAIGNALGEFDNTVTSGIISGLGRPIVASTGSSAEELSNLFQTDAAINPGNSGGPLVNINGEVIGVNTAVAGGAENIGFSIPINDVKPALASVEENGKIIRPYLGVRYLMLTPASNEELNAGSDQGAFVYTSGNQPAVIPNSPADKAGLRERDVILKVGDKAVTEQTPLATLIGRYKVGDTVTLTIMRDGNEQTLNATLEQIPDSL